MMTIYAATTNAGKLREFAECAGVDGVEVLALPGLREMPEPVEDAATFLGNAELKAVAYSKLTAGLLVFADDSGLEVEALGGAPGVRSARFAEDWEQRRVVLPHPNDDEALMRMGQAAFEPGTQRDERNNALLLWLMQDVGEGLRGARFVCALALAKDGEVALRAEGFVAGKVLREARGEGGFGYDPLFFLPELGATTAELPQAEKWAVSHRGRGVS